MTNPIQNWKATSAEHAWLFEQEALIVEVTEAIWALMEEQALNKADLAVRLGVSRAHITQLLNGSRNMTLRTLADIAQALGVRVRIVLDARQEAALSPPPASRTESRRHTQPAAISSDARTHSSTTIAASVARPARVTGT